MVLAVEFLKNDYASHQYRKYNDVVLRGYKVSEAARNQPKSGQLLCWIATHQKNHNCKVQAVYKTWLKRCDSYHILTDRLPPFYLSLFWKTHLALYYIYTYISKDFDWKYLSTLNPSKPYYLGYRLKLKAPKNGYNSGSAYVLSKEAMRIYAEKLFSNHSLCPFHIWEDLGLARCLAKFSIYPTDTRDSEGRQRFFAFRPTDHLTGNLWKEAIFDEVDEASKNIFHENVVSFHHLTADEIIMMELGYQQRENEYGGKNKNITKVVSNYA
uniref:Glycoprotein-N-acetylgalactosamine 3-beta-galactosyltransferase 1 n=1 Tax=Syphacia muris TaxID=451379 RepID=A0A0N5AUU7_9BILA